MLMITIKSNNLKSKVNLKTKMVCEIITSSQHESTINDQMAGKFFYWSTEQKKFACSAKAPHLSFEINWRKKNSISPGKIDVDEAYGVITGKLDSKICS